MYIDCHTHLDSFKENIEDAIKEINDNKILTLANSMDIESYIENKEYSRFSEYIKPCFGIHPWRASEYKGSLEELIPYIEDSEIIGEIGLDFLWVEDKSTFEEQRKIYNFILKECYFTISVDIGYSDRTKEILTMIPKDKLLLETDGPTALEWINGEYGYPSEIIKVYKKVATIKGYETEELINIVQNNYYNLLGR